MSLKENKMGVMPVGRLLLTMALPMALSMLVQALYNVVDSAFVSRISDTNNDALTAVGLAFPVQNIMIGIASGIAVGVNALLSRALGERDQTRVNRAALNGVLLAACGTALAALFGVFCARPFMQSMSQNPEVIRYGVDYIRVITLASFGIFGEILFERLLQSTGRTAYTLVTQGTGAIINIILDPILIFGLFGLPRMEVMGAAVATVIGQIVAFALAIVLNLKKNPDVQLRFRGFRPSGSVIGKILGIGVPSTVMIAISSLMYYLFNLVLGRFNAVEFGLGETGTTVFGVYYKLQSFIFMPVFGINNALLAICAYNYGARQPKRITGTIRCGVLAASTLMLIGVAVFELIPEQLLGFFNADEAMLRVGVPALRILATHFLLAGASIIFSGAFQGLGKSIYSMYVSLARQLIVLIPAAFLLSMQGNIDLVWLSFPIAEAASLTLSALLLGRLNRKMIRPLEKTAENPLANPAET